MQITIVCGSPRATLMKFNDLLVYHKPHVADYISICLYVSIRSIRVLPRVRYSI